MRALPLLSLTILFVAGCSGPTDLEAPETASSAAQALTVENGTNLNGTNLNGTNLNGTNLNGTDLSGFMVSTAYNPTKLNGVLPLERVWLEGTTFVGVREGTVYRGADFLQAEFLGNLGDGSQVRLRIKHMGPAPAPNSDLTLYDVEYRADDLTWKPACRDASGTPTRALPLQGVWDYRIGVPGGGSHAPSDRAFTFACLGGAIAKCTLMGYRPWTTYNGKPLAPFHQACTRVLRADYCGTGTPYTQNNRLINVYDSLGIQTDDQDWVFEAEWDEGGARCFYPLNRSRSAIPCYDERVDQFCGQELQPDRGVLLVNETPGDGLLKE